MSILSEMLPEPPSSSEAWARERDARRAAEADAARWMRLQAATAALSRARTPDEVAAVAGGPGVVALGGTRGCVLVPEPSGGALELLRGVAGERANKSVPQHLMACALEVWRSGRPLFIEDAGPLAPVTSPPGPGVRCGAVAIVPLEIEGRALGVLVVVFDGPRAFPEEERAFAGALGGQCAQALERARLFVAERLARAEAVAAQRRLAFLDGLSTHLADTLAEPELVAGVVARAVPALADWAAIHLAGEDGTLTVASAAGAETAGGRASELLAGEHAALLGEVARGAAALAIDVAGGAEGPRSIALAPLAIRGRCLGAVAVASADPARRYGQADLALLSDVARRTALAVEHARVLSDAQFAARAREEFLHVASHELRGPVGTLRMAVQLLGRDLLDVPESGAARSRARVIERQAERLVRLADRLLDVSRITAGRLVLEREPADVAALVRDAVGRVADEAKAVGCAVSVDASAPVLGAFDVPRVEQVITNLLSNALKYGRGAPVEVDVREEDGRAVLVVQDRGIGIAPEDQERIFGRFERAVSARNYSGLGLGLWIVQRLVEAHGGAISVASAPGEGARFTVSLPLAAS